MNWRQRFAGRLTCPLNRAIGFHLSVDVALRLKPDHCYPPKLGVSLSYPNVRFGDVTLIG